MEQVEKLVRFDPRLSSAELVFSEEKHEKHVEGILSIDGSEPIVAHGVSDKFSAAGDQLVDKLARLLRKGHSRRVEHRGGAS